MALHAEAERAARPGAGLGDLLGRFMNSKPISTDHIANAAADLIGIFVGGGRAPQQPPPGPTGGGAWGPWWEPIREQTRQQHQAPPPRPPPAPPDDLARARKVLGFKPNDKITKDELRKQYRKLALKFHPDRKGGSATKMAELNHSRDVLERNLV